MKKWKVLMAVFCGGILLTGCGKEETLTCTNTQSASGVKMDQEVSIKFNGNKVKNVKMSVNSEATTEVIKSNWDVFASTLDKQYKAKDADGIKVKTTNNKDKYTYKIDIEIDLDKANKDSLAEYKLESIVGAKGTKKETKEAAEKSGFTCK